MQKLSKPSFCNILYTVHSALDKFRLEGIQDDIADIQYLWSMITKSVSNFEDYLNHGQVITEPLAAQFYAHSFREVKKITFFICI